MSPPLGRLHLILRLTATGDRYDFPTLTGNAVTAGNCYSQRYLCLTDFQNEQLRVVDNPKRSIGNFENRCFLAGNDEHTFLSERQHPTP